MRAKLLIPEASTVFRGDILQTINAIFEQTRIDGVAQFRVGLITVGILDLTKAVTFDSAMDGSYVVLLQPQSGIAASTYPSAQTSAGFTLNLTLGVVATIAYLAISIPD